MIYKLNGSELRQIAAIYEVDISALAERLDFEDDIVEFLPFQGGIKIETNSGQKFTLCFKDGLKLQTCALRLFKFFDGALQAIWATPLQIANMGACGVQPAAPLLGGLGPFTHLRPAFQMKGK